jgi:trigger factor
MEVIEQRIDDLNAELVIRIQHEDYKEQYEEALRKIRKQVNIPGFRSGKVPTQVIKKRYGGSVLAEELQKIINQGLNDHINGNKLDILGGPLPKEDSKAPGDWENPGQFEFTYQLGLSPKFDLKFGKEKYRFYKVKVDDKLVDQQIDDFRRRYGKLSEADDIEEKDLVLGVFQELDKKENVLEGGITHESSISMEFIEDKARKPLLGLKVGESVVLNPEKVSKGDADMAAMLGVTKDQLKGLSDKFRFTVKSIKRIELADLGQDMYDKIFGPGQVTDAEQMRERIKTDLVGMFERDSDRLLLKEITDDLMERHKIALPDAFLKRWIVESSEGENQLTMEQVEGDYENYSKSLRWQLIENKLITENNLTAGEEELVNFTMGLLARNYQQYNVPLPDTAELEASARRVLGNRDEARKIGDMLYEQKLTQFFKTEARLSEKEVSYDDFLKIARGEK